MAQTVSNASGSQLHVREVAVVLLQNPPLRLALARKGCDRQRRRLRAACRVAIHGEHIQERILLHGREVVVAWTAGCGVHERAACVQKCVQC